MFNKEELRLIMCALNDAFKYNRIMADDEFTNKFEEVEFLRSGVDYKILEKKVEELWKQST